MKLVDLEAHFITRALIDYADKKMAQDLIYSKLVDLADERLRDMDGAGIEIQVLSLHQRIHVQRLEPSVAKNWARSINDELAAAVKKHPDRFVGLAALPLQNPDEAVAELERAVLELGLKGACILSNSRDEYYDDEKYLGIFETAQKLDVPLYIHPTVPSSLILGAYAGYDILRGPTHGFYAEVALHVMRLILSGLFDRYPGLKIILGHLGEGLPYWLPRLDSGWKMPALEGVKTKKSPSEYLKSNFTITTSGMFFEPAFICSYLALGADRIAFAVDYPPENINAGAEFIKSVPISDGDKEKVCHINAEALFKL